MIPRVASRAAGLDEDLYTHVSEWRTYPGYTEREQLAIEYAERFALDHRNIDDAFFGRLRAAYADDEIVDLTLCVSTYLAFGHFLDVLGLEDDTKLSGPGSTCPTETAAQARPPPERDPGHDPSSSL